MATTPAVRTASAGRTSTFVTLICWGMVVLEGYDLISFGSVLPVLVADETSGFNPENAGIVGAAAFVGAAVGALSAGWLSDRVGRKPVAVGSLIVFTVFTVLCGFAVGPWSLGILRFLAGIGIGAIIPSTSALTFEYATRTRRTLAYALMLSGVPIGGVFAAISGLLIIPEFGWRWVFFVALVPAVIIAPIVIARLPESVTFLEQTGKQEQAAKLRARLGLPERPQPGVEDETATTESATAAAATTASAIGSQPVEGSSIFASGYRAASLLFAGATFFGLLTWFGLGTWIPGIMRELGYDLGSALTFLLVLNLGAIAGSLVIAIATDKWGSKKVVVATYLGLTVTLVLLLVQMPQAPLLVAMALAGVGGHGGQILINRFVSRSYPARMRASALGWTLGAGRTGTIIGPVVVGFVVAAGSAQFGFVFFATAAAACAVLLLLVPKTPASLREEE